MKPLTLFTVSLLVSVLCGSLAFAETRVTKVEQTQVGEHLEFSFHLNEPLSAEALTARLDDTLMILTLEQATVQRQWITPINKDIRRILVHPSRETGSSVLRVRYLEPVAKEIVANIRVRLEGNILIAAVPNNSAIAKKWADHAAKSKVEAKEALPEVVNNKLDTSNPVSEPEDEILVLNGSPSESEVDEKSTIELETNEAGMAATPSSSTPTLIVAMIMLMGVAFVLLKKMKQMKPASEGGPLIRPIGTHMLGPKQGLLLVDVAGEMVLLGTTDKGVQLLTKLDGTNANRLDDMGQNIETQTNEENRSENPFGKMLGQFRQASDRLREASVGGQKKGKGDMSDLNLLADDGQKFNRRQFQPITPKAPVPPYQSQTSLQERDALIEKLRMLKGA